MAVVRRMMLATLLALAASMAAPWSSSSTTALGDTLRSLAPLPGLWITELDTANDPYESTVYIADRDLLVVGGGAGFTVVDATTFDVVHEEFISNAGAVALSDDGSTLVASGAAPDAELIFFRTSDWVETYRVTTGIPSSSLSFAPGSVDTVLTRFNSIFTIVRPAPLAAIEFRDLPGLAFDPRDGVWVDASTLIVLAGLELHRVGIGTGAPVVESSAAIPRFPDRNVPYPLLHRAGDRIVSNVGWAFDPDTMAVSETWDPAEIRIGRRDTDDLLVRSGATLEYRRAGAATVTFEMPDPFERGGRWLLPLGDGRFAFDQVPWRVLSFGDADFLGSRYGDFTAITPTRLIDTRTGSGLDAAARIGPADSLLVQVTGTAGIPATGVTAVALNVSVVDASELTYVTLYPASAERPTAANVNVDDQVLGKAVSNFAIVRLDDVGRLRAYNRFGSVDLVLDLVGYFSDVSGPAGSRLVALDRPVRLADTRSPESPLGGRLGADTTRQLDVSGVGTAGDDVVAVALHIAAVRPSQRTYVAAWPADVERPLVAAISAIPARVSPNLTIVKVPPSGMINLFNKAGSVDLTIDVVGYFRPAGEIPDQGARYVPYDPLRILDTRESSPFPPPGAIPADAGVIMLGGDLIGDFGHSVTDFDANWTLALNLTAVWPQSSGYLSLLPMSRPAVLDGRPSTSNVNFGPDQNRANFGLVTARPDWMIYNSHGLTHAVVDLAGVFAPAEPDTSGAPFN